MRYSTKLALGVASAAAAGVAVYSARQQQLQKRLERATEVPFGTLHSASREVKANDGLRLHVEIDGDDLPGPTIVFAHGYVENVDVLDACPKFDSSQEATLFPDSANPAGEFLETAGAAQICTQINGKLTARP